MKSATHPSVDEVLQRLAPGKRVRTVGLKGASRAYVLAQLSRRGDAPLLCLTHDDEAADTLAEDLAFFLGGAGTVASPKVLRVPGDELLPWDELVPDQATVADRLSALFHLARGTPVRAVVLSVRALYRRVLPVDSFDGGSATLEVGQEHGRDALARHLVDLGYLNSALVEDKGSFSMRGDILDVFPPLLDKPVRLEFFGDTVESMRAFDPETQRTTDAVAKVLLLPARELFFSPAMREQGQKAIRAAAELLEVPSSRVRERLEQVREGLSTAGLEGLLPGFYPQGLSSLFDYLARWSKTPILYVDEPTAVASAVDELFFDIEKSHAEAVRNQELCFPPSQHFVARETGHQRLLAFAGVEGGGLSLDPLEREAEPVGFTFGDTVSVREAIRSHHGEEGALTPLLKRLDTWRTEQVAVVIACGTAGHADRVKRLLAERNVVVRVHDEAPTDLAALYDPAIRAHLALGDISVGFIDKPGGLALLSDEDLFGARAKRRSRRKRFDGGAAANFKDLKEGDLVVHSEFGVCRYGGLISMSVNGILGDFLALHFAGKDKVYLPVSRMRLISRFAGGSPEGIALDRLSSGAWEKTKARVRENLLKMAAELLKLYASRRAHPGHAFNPPDRYFHQFEADFPFDETVDQQKAIDDVIADMQKPQPMDRLICGDVGYGKTEVAMRAAFKAVLDRKQVAVLAPTTLLAHQHLSSFRKRMQGYPVTIEVVSGLRKASEVREVFQRAREGRLDVLIGTHKLLGADVAFRDLGLLIIDEEQRFGVKQKEAIKRFKSQVDTLTLSATPIPRTLNMAMSGLRDMSLITTPPQDRRAIRTFISRFDPALIKEAIEREVARGGQVFFVHNRINSIHSMEKFLKELVPNVTIGVGHGQMHEGELEKVMLDFVERRTQLLLSTTIIESGIDISTANTMIVNRADQYGLAQLYQLRGRVGRSKERAYAYLLVPARRNITKDAERRLEVLQAFTELGAGFTIASHDLEIRGAGSLLGGEQSGSIEAVGFELYAQMLEEAVAEMQGEPLRVEVEPDVNLPLPAVLPEDYVPDVHQRLVLYKRFSSASSPDELEDLRAEVIDRYGDAPDEVDALCEVMRLKMDLRDLGLRALDVGPGKLVLTLGGAARLDGVKLAALVQRSRGLYRLTPDMKLVARVDDTVKGEAWVGAARKVLTDLDRCAA